MPSALDTALPAGLAAPISRDLLPADADPRAEAGVLDEGLNDGAQEPADDNPVTPLYRLALGPVNPQHYLSIFERLDATGRTLPHWNWAAGLLTFNWMVFRRMWVAALGYVVVLEIALLLILGVGRYTLDWPTSVVAPMLLLLGLVAIMVPGLYGDAMLHADLRKRIARAFENASTASEARSMLQDQASAPRRIKVLAAINVALVAVLAIAFLPLLLGASSPLNLQPAVTVADASMVAAANANANASAGSNARAATAADAGAAPTPTLAMDTEAGSAASTADTAAVPIALAQSEAAASTSPPSIAHATAGAGAAAAGAVAASARTASPAPEPQTAPPTPTRQEREAARKALAAEKAAEQSALKPAKMAERQAAAKAARDTKKAEQAKKSAERAERKVTQAASKSASTSVSTPAVAPSKRKVDQGTPHTAARSRPAPSNAAAAAHIPVGTMPGYYIDAGLFSDEANARKAQAALLNEGLPAFRQTVSTARGKMVRVRVGPYASRARSQPAVAAIRAQGMEASVIRKQ